MTGTLQIYSLKNTMWGYYNDIESLDDEKDALNEQVDRDLDRLNKLYGIYNGDIRERENIKSSALAITEGTTVDPYTVLNDIGMFEATGDFDSVEDIMIFDTYLRGLLLDAGQPVQLIDQKVAEIAAQMQRGQDLDAILKKNNVNVKAIYNGNSDEITTYDLDKYMLTNKVHLNEVLVSEIPEVSEYVDERREYLTERKVSGVYHEYASQEELIKLYSKELVDEIDGMEYKADGMPYYNFSGITVEKDENGNYVEVSEQNWDLSLAKVQDFFAKPLEAHNKTFQLNQEIYTPKDPTKEQQEAYKEKSANYVSSGITPSSLSSGGNVAYADLSILNTINQNVDSIYSLLVYPPEQAEYDKYDAYQRDRAKVLNSDVEQLNESYTNTLNSIVEEYNSITGGYSNNAIYQNNIMMMLNGLKNDAFANIVISTSDLLVDSKNANNAAIILEMIELLETSLNTPKTKTNVQNIKSNSFNAGEFIGAVAKGMKSANGIMPSVLP